MKLSEIMFSIDILIIFLSKIIVAIDNELNNGINLTTYILIKVPNSLNLIFKIVTQKEYTKNCRLINVVDNY